MRAWEDIVVLADAYGRAEPALDALQFPYTPGEPWFGLELPSGATAADRLLYTAHLSDPATTGPIRGLVVDEWSELIEDATATTGLAFQFDRTDNAAPQAMLLVVPPEQRGGWLWTDLVDAVNETLDLAKIRALQPDDLAALPYAAYLPATVTATQARQLTIAADLALNNNLVLKTEQ